ncbi:MULTISPECIES: hypothetical protein [unclassified Herbaspirillum]|uniref:hypothetical protein n=1 Tax=unclassified Herbaspirillum TaxID=2624150 RepID=UPI00114F097D|nr:MULTISPECIES: hypothetical protein [unclassified Herbaspirillum]MBB5393499.1 hypothetical protein [Herbaspirillum sp. SJZ102]TQK03753.1 hypothetical protein FB599_3318 [Herbaspirillum sp. SJZ130]TQK08485.1 hypothetical protein FB598_3257 [Herbaspirillum sp. SJZ106]
MTITGTRLLPITLLCTALLAGCASSPAPHGQVKGADASSREMGQSDTNRMSTLAMRANLDGLYLLMDKLYRRNPGEWKKTAASREEALAKVREAVEKRQPWPELQGKRDIAAMALALSTDFKGDRVAAFIYATADMLIVAHGNKIEFFLIDGLDAQHLYNAARNVEIGAWILASRRNAAGGPLLLSDEISADMRNLSFEREFGKIVGRLDLLATFITEKYRRAGISYVQNLLGGSFLQFLPVR